MSDHELHKAFEEAFQKASNTLIPIPQDDQLRLYALYKQASFDITFPTKIGKEHHLVSGFKSNALFQVKNLTPKEAQRAYIELVNKLIKD